MKKTYEHCTCTCVFFPPGENTDGGALKRSKKSGARASVTEYLEVLRDTPLQFDSMNDLYFHIICYCTYVVHDIKFRFH